MRSGKSFFWLLRRRIVWPIMLIFFIVAALGLAYMANANKYIQTSSQDDLKSELRSFVGMQYFSLQLIESPMNKRLNRYCDDLKNRVFTQTSDIENADLHQAMLRVGIDTSVCDLSIINRNGVIVNTTAPDELYVDFSTFGDNHTTYLDTRFKKLDFGAPFFFFDSRERRFVKYVYQPTADGRYVIEIGTHSTLADSVYNYVDNYLKKMVSASPYVLDITQYAMTTRPKSFNIDKQFPREHYAYLYDLQTKGEVLFTQKVDGRMRQYIYMYLDCIAANDIYKGIILGVEIDRESIQVASNSRIVRYLIVLLIIAVAVLVFTYFVSQKIENSIGAFADNARKLTENELHTPITEYTDVVGEVGNLTRLLQYFNQLSSMVASRDGQIAQQNAEISALNRKLIDIQELVNVQKQLVDVRNSGSDDSGRCAYYFQQALLPQPGSFAQMFPDSFAYIRPRGIVNGDFYWFAEVDGRRVVVVADCTGHSVQAGFYTVITATLLQNIVCSQRITDPSLILSRLDTELARMLSGVDESLRYEDAEMAVCTIDSDAKKLTFAGARRRIIIVSGGVPHTYKGSIFPLGANCDTTHKMFDNTIIDIIAGDAVYMFTNGYVSQFNADDTEKFNYEPFRHLVSEIYDLPMEAQMVQLDKALKAWQGTTVQTDDILVLGFKC